MRNWTFFNWVAYSLFGLSIAINAYEQTVRRSVTLGANLPDIDLGVVALALFICATFVFIAKELGWVETKRTEHRVRCAMDESDIEPLGGIVEIDETFIGGKPRRPNNVRKVGRPKVGPTSIKAKQPVMGMLERNGRVRPRVIADVRANTLRDVINQNVDKSARIMTDDWAGYKGLSRDGWKHETVNHSRYEFARGDVTTNRIEGFFGILKRGLNGIYHAVSRKHLHRYLSEFEFRYNNSELTDGQRVIAAIKAAQGKRLTYAQQVADAT